MAQKIVSLAQAVESVKDDSFLGLCGFAITRNAIAFAHEIIRQGRKNLTVASCAAGMDSDLLVGAGSVKRMIYSGGSLDRFGLLACINRAIAEGEIETEEYSGLSMSLRFLAGGLGLSYISCNSLLGSDILKNLLDKVPDQVKEATCPFTGEKQVLLRGLRPDLGVVVANYADEEGNAVLFGPTWEIKEMAHASKRVVVIAEQIVPKSVITAQPELTMIPGAIVDMVVEVPYASHPTSVYRCYDYDAEHLKLYGQVSREPEAIKAYIEEYVLGTKDHWGYLEKIGVSNLLKRIAKPIKGY